MQTHEVPRSGWARSLQEFSAVHEGWLVSMDVLDAAIGAQVELANLPLLGISLDPSRGDDVITISVSTGAGTHVTHTIHNATRLLIERRDDLADVALQVESSNGPRTILRFRAAALPETVDGVAPV